MVHTRAQQRNDAVEAWTRVGRALAASGDPADRDLGVVDRGIRQGNAINLILCRAGTGRQYPAGHRSKSTSIPVAGDWEQASILGEASGRRELNAAAR